MYHFDILLPSNKDWFSTKEAAQVIGRSPEYVRQCFESQKMLGHSLNGRKEGRERRQSLQIHRDCLVLYLLQSANYQPIDYFNKLCQILKRLDREERQELRKRLDALW